MIANLFNTYLYQPILLVLIFIYKNLTFNDLGLAIIVLTVFIRLILFPLFYKSAKDQALMARLQPHIKKIQLDHKDNREAQAKALLALYREHRLNPFSGFLLLLLQLPVLIALYQVFIKEITNGVFINNTLLGFLDLGEKSLLLAVIAALLQYFQGKLSAPVLNQPAAGQFATAGRMMILMAPALTLVVLINFPAALGVYWVATTLFSLGQQVIINRNLARLNPKHGERNSKNKTTAAADGL